MTGIEPLMIAAMVGGTAMEAGGKIMAGREGARAAAYEQQQLRAQEQSYRTAAAQDETRRRDELTASLETIEVLRGGRGVGAGSPTGMAILDAATEDVRGDIITSRANYLTKADQSRTGAEMAGKKAKTSLLAGFMGAGASVMDAGWKLGTYDRYPAGRR